MMTTPTPLRDRTDDRAPDTGSTRHRRWWRPELRRSVGTATLAAVVLSIGSTLGGVLVGYLAVALGVLGLLTIPLQQLLIGGALTGVVLGIAAQQSLANLFAGLVLLGTRPRLGNGRVRVHSGALGGPLDGQIVEMGLMYTILDSDGETVHIPNSALLGAAISTLPDNSHDSTDRTDSTDDGSG